MEKNKPRIGIASRDMYLVIGDALTFNENGDLNLVESRDDQIVGIAAKTGFYYKYEEVPYVGSLDEIVVKLID